MQGRRKGFSVAGFCLGGCCLLSEFPDFAPNRVGRMKPPRHVRTLAPIPLSTDKELRLELVEVDTTRFVHLTTWYKYQATWNKLPGDVSVPVGVIPELHNRLNAASGPATTPIW